MQIEIGGRHLTVRSDAPEAKVHAVVAELNARLADLRDKSQAVSSDQLVLLTALNMAEELYSLREKHEALKSRVQDRGQRLLKTLDQLSCRAASGIEDSP